MIYLRKIVQEINKSIDANLALMQGFQRRTLWNICTSARGEVGGTEVIAPYYFNADGEGIFVGPDDNYEFILYHRSNGINVSPSQGQFGNGVQSVGLTATMSMTVFYNQKVICLSPDEVALLLISKIIVPPNIQYVKGLFINLDSVSFDKEAIFASEYRALPYNLSAEQQLLRINYTLEGTFRKDCLNICDLTPPIITPPPTEPPTVNVLHLSLFNVPDGTLLTDYIPEVGNKYEDLAGSGQIINGRLTGKTWIGSNWVSRTLVPSQTFTMTETVVYFNPAIVYVLFRGEANSSIFLSITIGSPIPVTQNLDGVISQIASAPAVPMSPGVPNVFKLIVKAASFDFLINNIPVFTDIAIHPDITGNGFSLGSAGTNPQPNDVYFEDVLILP